MKILIAVFFSIMSIIGLKGQSLTDALRYSSLIPGGTSRVMGSGGSFGAMGGDFGVLTINPAGLADFRSNELMFSFSFNGGDTKSALSGNPYLKTSHVEEPQLENLGVVFHSQPRNAGLETSNLAIGLNQYNNFSQDFGFEGYSKGSITERFAELANNRAPEFFDPFEATLAYETGAIFDFGEDQVYETDFDTIQEVYKKQDVSRSGKISELAIAWAGKFDNNLSLGIGIGIPFITFEENKIYQEQDLDNRTPFFNNLTFAENLTTSGTGFNFKLGLGYDINRTIRLGLAYQSPTYYKLDDNYDTQMIYSYTDSIVYTYESASPDGRFNYKLTTPSRLTASIGTIFNTGSLKGFINFDAQYINYTKNRFDFTVRNNDPSEAEFEREVNTEIDNELQSSFNFNLGGELVFDKFRLRGGLGLIGSPYYVDGASTFDEIYSIGGGFRADRVYFDLACQFRNFSQGYIPYQVIDENRLQSVTNETNQNKFVITVGFKI
jgi:long-subunit fatty acid transport protein